MNRRVDELRVRGTELSQETGNGAAGLGLQWIETDVAGLVMRARVSSTSPTVPRVSASDPPSVVLVHGLAVSSRYMVPTAERLAKHFRVFAPDLPGFGKSDTPRRALFVSELADALDAWLDAVGLEHPVLVGNSLGCQIIVNQAARRPGHAAGLVLSSPTIDARRRSIASELWRLMRDIPREHWSLTPINAREYFRTGPLRALATLRAALVDRIEDRMPLLGETPVLVVRGTRDPIVSERWAARLAALAPRGEYLELLGAPHAVNYSAAAAFSELIIDFVQRIRRPPD